MINLNILVVCIEAPGKMGKHSQQLIQKAHGLLKDKTGMVSVFCNGDYSSQYLMSYSAYGADEIILLRDKNLGYREVASVIADYIKNGKHKPSLILIPCSDWGRCIASDLSIKIGGGLVAECIDIEMKILDGKYQYISTRAAINSSVLAQIQCVNTMFTICTCKNNVFIDSKLLIPKNISVFELRSNSVHKVSSHLLKTENVIEKEKNLNLENAQIVFGIGRGIKDREGMELVENLAKKYNAAIAGTRALVEEGVISKNCQVGQSGINIAPSIYVAFGISGATQHIVGIKNAKKIISINTDPEAPIFKFSDYCIVDDCKKILSALI